MSAVEYRSSSHPTSVKWAEMPSLAGPPQITRRISASTRELCSNFGACGHHLHTRRQRNGQPLLHMAIGRSRAPLALLPVPSPCTVCPCPAHRTPVRLVPMPLRPGHMVAVVHFFDCPSQNPYSSKAGIGNRFLSSASSNVEKASEAWQSSRGVDLVKSFASSAHQQTRQSRPFPSCMNHHEQ